MPKSVQEGSRAGSGPPKRSQEQPKSAPKQAKRYQKVPQTLPKPSPTSPKTRFERHFCGKLCSAGSGSDFTSFFCFVRNTRDIRKPWKNLCFSYVFAYPERMRKTSLCSPKSFEKPGKKEAWEFQNSPKTPQNRVRSGPRRPKKAQDGQKVPTKWPRNGQERKKRRPRAKNVPTWLQQDGIWTSSLKGLGFP